MRQLSLALSFFALLLAACTFSEDSVGSAGMPDDRQGVEGEAEGEGAQDEGEAEGEGGGAGKGSGGGIGEGEAEAEAEAEAEGEGPPADTDGEAGTGGGFAGDEGEGEAEAEAESEPEIEPGQLTAGDWDDNLNFDFFLDYLAETTEALPSLPFPDVEDRVVITVKDADGSPIPNARVTVAGTGLVGAPTSTAGKLVFFPGRDGAADADSFDVTVEAPQGQSGVPAVQSVEEGAAWEIVLGAEPALPEALDLAFVVDATGSMGDEIEYLKVEIADIAARVSETSGLDSVRYALIVYRDVGDEYVVRTFDFTASLDSFQEDLDDQVAGGGGDYPEAAEQALGAMNQLAWRGGNVARVAFFIADAPPHAANLSTFVSHAHTARRAGVKIYPLAASGVADEAEYVMRLAAQATLGRYLFLTDDSGIGGEHAEPHIPCYEVQILADLIVRAVQSELVGHRIEADPSELVRTVGNPSGGMCTQEDGDVFYIM